MRLLLAVLMMGAAVPGPQVVLRTDARAGRLHCHLTVSGEDTWRGSCGRWLGEVPTFALGSEATLQSGKWRSGADPVAMWSGKMFTRGDGPVPNSPEPVELEIYLDHTGVFRTLEGWYAVESFERGPRAIEFTVEIASELPPSDLDVKIVQRAAAILSSTSVWNRDDNRQCPAVTQAWSIYCAMERATIEVTGGFHHRRPAMETVRAIVDQRTSDRNYHHRLMDYNNDSSTSLADVQSLFAQALRQMSAR